jgi:hypothetical protein
MSAVEKSRGSQFPQFFTFFWWKFLFVEIALAPPPPKKRETNANQI